MDNIILITLVTAIIAVAINIVLKKVDIPPIIGYIFSGAIIGTVVALGGGNQLILEHIAEFGIVFLMFTIGLEIKLESLIEMKKKVFLYGGLQVILTMAVFTVLAHYLFAFNIKASLIIGSALSLSSTAIVLKLMNESNEISKPYGQNTLGVLIFQDLAVIPILLMLTIFGSSTTNLSDMLLNIMIDAIGLIVVMVLFGKYFLDMILHIVDSTNARELFILIVLIIAIGSSYLSHEFGFTYSLGAFIGGMLIAETHYKHQIEADLIPFRDLFLALFFVTVGMQIDIRFLSSNIVNIVSLGFGILVLKAFVIFLIFAFYNKTIAFQTALAISQVGEFSFVIFTQAIQIDLLDKNTGQLLTLAVILSMLLTPLILKNIRKIVQFVFGNHLKTTNTISSNEILTNHVVVCGYGEFGKKIVQNLKIYDANYIIIIDNYELFEQAINSGEKAIFGNPMQKSILLEANIHKAKVAIIALHDVEHISLISHAVSDINKDIKIIAKVTKKDVFDTSINTDDFIDIYSFTAGLISTQTFGYLNTKNKD